MSIAHSAPLLHDAHTSALSAAERSRVTVRGLHELDELGGLIDLFDRVWDNDGPPPIGLEHLRALAHAGNYVVGAFDRETGTLLGGTVAFFAAPVGQVLHSDVTGVDPSARDRRLGFALKTDQRAWCLDRAIETVVWTFDPLIARNAYFNLVKLRARADRYFIDFYGDMDDGINAGQGSDRLFVTWDLTADDVADACTGRSEPTRRSDPAVPPLLSTTQSGPEIQTVSASTDVVRVEVPRDIETLRRVDPDLARAWRHGVRATLGSELAAGGSIIGFDPAAGYVVKRSRGTPRRRPVKIQAIELRTVALPLKSPFRTSFATEYDKEAVLVRVVADVGEGWGECVASEQPLYSSEYNAMAIDVIGRFMAPALFAAGNVRADDVARILAPIKGHRMSKAALEMAVLDAELRARGESFANRLGGVVDKVPSGVSVGIMDSIPELVAFVADYLDQGYVRIKLKIEPGWDVEPVRVIRERFGDIPLQVDANTAYGLVDAQHLARLDAYDLLLIEQPLGEEDIRQHAELAKLIRTPVCLDESIVSVESAADAIALGACRIINIKAGRVGGYLEATKIHELARANGIAVWCGGMVETGLGRAANAALASLPGFTLPGDVSGSDRFFSEDITAPIAMQDGYVEVPTAPGLGVEPIPEILAKVTADVVTLTP